MKQHADQEKNRKILDELLPLISKKIDDQAGVMRVPDLASDLEVKKLLDQIPGRLPRTLTLLLPQWGDFFVSLSNNLVGTALGYDTGMIREDGTVEPAYLSTFVDSNGDPLDEAVPFNPNKVLKVIDLVADADRLWKCALDLDNDADLKTAFKICDASRRHIRGEDTIAPPEYPGGVPWSGLPPPNPKKLKGLLKGKGKGAKGLFKAGLLQIPTGPINLSEQERVLRKEKILYRIVEILSRCPNQTKNMCLLVSDPSIKELKKGAISKFLAFLQEFPTMFRIINIEGTPQYNITLMDRHVPIIKPNGAHVTTSVDVVRNLQLNHT